MRIKFKMERKSGVASKLKSSISHQLLHFLSDYTDDVLAEYITVLICNGKDQCQATDDLHAFLGDRSAQFVSWLWDLLVKYSHQSSEVVCLSDPKYDATAYSNLSLCSRPWQTEDGDIYELSKRATSAKQQPTHCMDEFNKISYSNSDGFPNHLLQLPNRVVSKNLHCSMLEHSCPRQIRATNVSGTSLPSVSVVAVPYRNEKPRGSVWDRLGKPCADISAKAKIVDAHSVVIDEVLNQPTAMLPEPNDEVGRNVKKEVSGQGITYPGNNPPDNCNLEHRVSTVFKPRLGSNIRRKRHFGEIVSSSGRPSVSRCEKTMDPQCKGFSQDSKKPKFMSNDCTTNPKVDSEVLDVKQRLHQIEMEMSNLRSKQLEMVKDGKPDILSHSGLLKHPEEDLESRTVFVTNVHFAATREALSFYFSRCGVIQNVVTLTDKATGQSKGSAYLTFASKDSVDRALALSGTTFFSRTVKVSRKAEASSVTLAPSQLPGKSSRPPLSQLNKKANPNRPYYSHSHLQWRRGAVSAKAESLASSAVQEKVNTESTSQQQFPGSPVPV
ncbi:RRM_1 domain-containing protein/PWI domain-containing protein [Cephalotus follicularis]|uniref:RRM_1 domain-containing protein/PWI domain-containing protein n=1 Tax=Cephalotus follicularis TaxID=3775 RepID=A0A1Q3B706_CEPFO|nr:RRM_1 domain-containing protein/PWI domain-containing protein [Cephalotus follicularis]